MEKKKIIDLSLFSIIVVFSDTDPNVKKDFTSLVINDYATMMYFFNSINIFINIYLINLHCFQEIALQLSSHHIIHCHLFGTVETLRDVNTFNHIDSLILRKNNLDIHCL